MKGGIVSETERPKAGSLREGFRREKAVVRWKGMAEERETKGIIDLTI